MLLYEFEGLELFDKVGINTPKRQLISSPNEEITISAPLVLKAQVLSGKRLAAGGVIKIEDKQATRVKEYLTQLLSETINHEKVEKVLVEETIEYDKEFYLSFSYSTETRGPVMTFSSSGGTGIEDQRVKSYPIDILKGYKGENVPKELTETAKKLWEVFIKYDLELAEINPLVISSSPSLRASAKQSNSEIAASPSAPRNDKRVYALDAKVILDDDGDFRREMKFPERNLFGRAPTMAEIEARKIDEGDHRGTAGSVYWDLPGDIAVLAAGGGGSVVNMDALIALGGKPANYTEHSGNPPREKLKKLTKILLSRPGLKGLWIVGGTANFTDIYETLMGFVEGLREVDPKPAYPIVIRRGGPNDKKAFEELKEIGEKEGYDFHIYGRETPMTSTAKIIVDLAYGKK
ncbi:MAG: ATP citrate lyase citrate-binding domain-containing protein [Candidatus Daviesbacteria bacterium]|nr:ATP citrate lyase citrate-binding domain-containing protein [Candidatus Daviesbacteria bacterium]